MMLSAAAVCFGSVAAWVAVAAEPRRLGVAVASSAGVALEQSVTAVTAVVAHGFDCGYGCVDVDAVFDAGAKNLAVVCLIGIDAAVVVGGVWMPVRPVASEMGWKMSAFSHFLTLVSELWLPRAPSSFAPTP